MHDIAMGVGDNLNFDVAWSAKIFFDVHRVITEGCFCFGTCGAERFDQRIFRESHFHAATTTTGGGFHKNGEAHLFGDPHCFLVRCHRTRRTRNNRNAKCLHSCLRRNLVAHQFDVIRGRADEGDAVGFEDFSEPSVL